MARKKYSDLEIQLMQETAENIKKFLRLRGMFQTDIVEKTGIATSTMSDYANAKTLISMGNLEKVSEALNVTKSEIQPSLSNKVSTYYRNIPLIGTICAGDGLLADQNIEAHIHYPFHTKRQPDFALRVKGDSMINAGIENGDIVFMRDAPWAEYNGQIVAALINDDEDGTLKRMKWSEGSPMIRLVPENDTYSTIEIFPNQVKVCGVYMGHFRSEEGIDQY